MTLKMIIAHSRLEGGMFDEVGKSSPRSRFRLRLLAAAVRRLCASMLGRRGELSLVSEENTKLERRKMLPHVCCRLLHRLTFGCTLVFHCPWLRRTAGHISEGRLDAARRVPARLHAFQLWTLIRTSPSVPSTPRPSSAMPKSSNKVVDWLPR